LATYSGAGPLLLLRRLADRGAGPLLLSGTATGSIVGTTMLWNPCQGSQINTLVWLGTAWQFSMIDLDHGIACHKKRRYTHPQRQVVARAAMNSAIHQPGPRDPRDRFRNSSGKPGMNSRVHRVPFGGRA
jgi:hypothetical protein